MNSALKYFFHKWVDSNDKWHPILSVFYLTYQCDFRCTYCSDGSEKPYYTLSKEILPGPEVISILKKIRSYTDYLVITGGEPLNYPDLEYVMNHLNGLKFKEVIFTTNGYNLDIHLDLIVNSVSTIVFSIDTMDSQKADLCYGIGEGSFNKIKSNVEQVLNKKDRKCDIMISSVITPDNIADLYDVYNFAKYKKIELAACPQLVGVKAHEMLIDNINYKEFYDYLINEKLKGANIFGTVKYLKHMRDLKKFRCRPFTMLVVSPNGNIFYPCLEKGYIAGNILDENRDLHSIRIEGEIKFGPKPECGNQCHSACALGFSIALYYPLTIIREIYLTLKGILLRHFNKL